MSEVKVNKISPRTNCGTVTVGDAGDSVTVTAGVPVTVNGDLKSNALKAVDGGSIISQCGTTITLGASGDTISLACGATQTGFGRTGTVDWDTTAKTAAFTAVSGNGYFVNTTSGAITVTLPASPSAGDIVSVSDYNGTVAVNAITIARNGSNINGSAANYDITKANSAVTFVYVDATAGWTDVQTANTADNQSPFIVASGGNTITTCGDFKIHTFTSPGTFCVSKASNTPAENIVSYLVVAGGGGGRDDGGASQGGAGGGGGGFRENKGPGDTYTASPLEGSTDITITATAFPITVGAGGARQSNDGSNSVFSTITSTGGGGGGVYTNTPGRSGGSGGGGGANGGAGGAGNTPPVSPPQGNPGSPAPGGSTPGAGGGAGAAGSGQTGGAGAGTNINTATGESGPGPSRYYAGGGASGAPPGPGGIGGGGDRQVAGGVNTGGGGGGGNSACTSKAGGSGIVIIRYKYQ